MMFANKHIDGSQDFWKNTLWMDETQTEVSGRLSPISSVVKLYHIISQTWFW